MVHILDKVKCPQQRELKKLRPLLRLNPSHDTTVSKKLNGQLQNTIEIYLKVSFHIIKCERLAFEEGFKV